MFPLGKRGARHRPSGLCLRNPLENSQKNVIPPTSFGTYPVKTTKLGEELVHLHFSGVRFHTSIQRMTEMSKFKQILSVSFLFLWVALPLVAQDLENPDYLKQGAWGLAKQNKPQSLYLFLEGQFPTFTATAQKAGLVDLLDGTRNWSSFEADWKTELKSYTPQKGQPSEAALSKLFESFKSVMTVNPTKAATPGESVAEFLQNRPPPDVRAKSLFRTDPETDFRGSPCDQQHHLPRPGPGWRS